MEMVSCGARVWPTGLLSMSAGHRKAAPELSWTLPSWWEREILRIARIFPGRGDGQVVGGRFRGRVMASASRIPDGSRENFKVLRKHVGSSEGAHADQRRAIMSFHAVELLLIFDLFGLRRRSERGYYSYELGTGMWSC